MAFATLLAPVAPRPAAEDVMIRTCPSGRVDPRFLIEPFEPAYLATHRAGVLAERVAAGLRVLEDCCACPRNCHVNRLANEMRVRHTGRYARVASVRAWSHSPNLRVVAGVGVSG